MCQSVSLLGTAVADVTPSHSPTLQTLRALVPFLAYASSSSRRSPVTPPSLICTLWSHVISSSSPLSAFILFSVCSYSLILEPIDLQSEWPSGARVGILQRDLGACKPRGAEGRVWAERLSGKVGAIMHADWTPVLQVLRLNHSDY